VRQVNVKRICFRVIVNFHSLKLLSGNALWIVILSFKVTTRKTRFPNSAILAQNLTRLSLCTSTRIGFSTTNSHHSFFRYERFRKTSFSK
jgi:hypothetical protein